MCRQIVTIIVAVFCGLAVAEEPQWVNISDALLKSVPNYRDSWTWNRRIGTLTVDPGNGDLYAVLNNSYGVYRSADQGATWELLTRDTRGRTYGSYSVSLDPATGRMVVFMIGQRSAMSMDRGKTWTSFGIPKVEDKHDGWTWGGVDWTAEVPKVMLAKEHHKERLWLSGDAGQTWKQLEYYTRRPGVLDADTFVAGQKEGIYRSTDRGASWDKVRDTAPTGATPIRYGKRWYWVCASGVLATDDTGATWKQQGAELKEVLWGPYFGADANQMMAVAKDGFYITRNACADWHKVAGYYSPTDGVMDEKMKGTYNADHPNSSFGWDHRRGIIYAASLAGSAAKLQLAATD